VKAIFRSSHIFVAALLLLLGISGTARAGLVTECDRQGWYAGSFGDLSGDDIKALNEKRKAFADSIRVLHHDICSKELELQTELAIKTPNAERATILHAEISMLESKLNRKRLIYILWKTKTRLRLNDFRK
jgi:hypothetical protein